MNFEDRRSKKKKTAGQKRTRSEMEAGSVEGRSVVHSKKVADEVVAPLPASIIVPPSHNPGEAIVNSSGDDVQIVGSSSARRLEGRLQPPFPEVRFLIVSLRTSDISYAY